MSTRLRVILIVHVLVAAYCITCGALDTHSHFRAWLVPNAGVFYCLLASAVALPIAAAVCVVGSHYRHPIGLVLIHVTMAAGQFFFGLLPLIS
jgi:hypothetical protein